MRFSARLLGITIAFFLVFFVSKISFAQTNSSLQNYQPQYMTPNTNPDVPKNLNTYTQNVMIEVMSAMSCQLMGTDPITKNKCLGPDQKTGKLGYVQQNGGVPMFLGKMITYLYTPPIQTSQYVQYLAQNFGIAKQTYAQGVGFNQLSPLIKLWTQFRDMTYLLFVFLFIIVGVAIMLRVKIDPRTVMTIQNQIPKLIIGIVLVTLSFPIAGFMVDLMWVSTYTVVSVISQADASAQPGNFQTQLTSDPLNFANVYFQSTDVNGGIHHVASEVSENVKSTIMNLFADQAPPAPDTTQPTIDQPSCTWGIFCGFTDAIGNVVGGAVNFVINAAGSIGNFLGNIVTGVLSMIIGFVAFLIIAIAIIYSLFKLWFALIKAYIMILIDVIFAPFWIIGGLLPGSNSLGFVNWLRNLAGNLAAFPAVVALFAIGKVFIDSFGPNTPAEKMFIPPLIGNIHGTSIISSLIALGIILASPSVVDTVKKAFKGQGGGGGGGGGLLGGAAIGAALGVGSKVVANPVKRAGGQLFGTDARGNRRPVSAYIDRKFRAGGKKAAAVGGAGANIARNVAAPVAVPVGNAASSVKSAVGKKMEPITDRIKKITVPGSDAFHKLITRRETWGQRKTATPVEQTPPAIPPSSPVPSTQPIPPAPTETHIAIPPARRTRPPEEK